MVMTAMMKAKDVRKRAINVAKLAAHFRMPFRLNQIYKECFFIAAFTNAFMIRIVRAVGTTLVAVGIRAD